MKFNLTALDAASDKETFHAEFDLTGSEIAYTSGDALGIYPLNNPPEVAAMVSALQSDAGAQVPVPQTCFNPRPQGESMSLGEALATYYDLKAVRADLVKLLSGSVSSHQQRQAGEKLLKDGVREGGREGGRDGREGQEGWKGGREGWKGGREGWKGGREGRKGKGGRGGMNVFLICRV